MINKATVCLALLAVYLSAYPAEKEKTAIKIVSLGPAVTENLFLLGAGDNIVADTVYCTRPLAAKNKEKIGNVNIVDVEKILSLKPDLVIATPLTNPEQVIKMRNVGLRVALLRAPRNLKELSEQFMYLAKLAGRDQYARKILDENLARVEKIKEKTKHLVKQKTFIQLGTNPLFTASKESFVHDYIDFAGGINVAGDSRTGIYSREQVIKDNPQVILIVTMGMAGEREKENWLKYKTIDAIKNNRIYTIDSYEVCSPTPISFVKALQEITGYLHPDIKVSDE